MNGQPLQILLIEDDLVDRIAFERFVTNEALSYDYTLAPSIPAARDIIRSRQFDIIISDYMLGSDTCLELFDEMGDTPVIVVTGTGDEKVAVAAMKRGASDYLVKDPRGNYLTTLPVTVDNALRRKRAERELVKYREHLEDLVQQATAQLRETNERLTALFRAIGDAVYVAGVTSDGRSGRIIDTNDAACRMLGYSRDEFVGRPLSDIEVPGSPTIDRDIIEVLHSGGDALLEQLHRSKDGREVPVEARVSGFSLGNETTIILTARDITDRKRDEQQKHELQEQLFRAQKMEAVGQLASGVAHDFNNLLMAITGQLELVSSQFPDNTVLTEAAKTIQDAVHQAVGVTRSLLTFSRDLPIEKKPILLQEAINTATRILRRLLPASVEIAIDCPADPPLWTEADATQIQQVVLNLAINARDAMPQGGTLRLSLAAATRQRTGSATKTLPPQDYACITVSDTGGGIPPEIRARLFDPFFTTKPRGQGTGLGLAIVHGIVEKHAGFIEVESQAGTGSTFKVFIPCIASRERDAVDNATAPAAVGCGELVLVAEDNQFVRGVVVSMLRQLGYQANAVSDGPALLEEWRKHRAQVRLLIMDVDLPVRGGLDCLRDLRDEGVTVPAVLITGSLSQSIEDKLDQDTLLLRKPFRINQMASIVGHLISAGAGTEQA